MSLSLLSFKRPQVGKNSRAGYTLLEMGLVMIVMVTLFASLWVVVALVTQSIYRKQTVNQILLTINNVRDFYTSSLRVQTPAGSSAAADLTNYLLRRGVLLPDQIRDRTAAVWVADLPWGPVAASGTVMNEGGFAIDAAGIDSSRFFRLTLRGLSRSNCITLSPALTGVGMPEGLTSVTINDNAPSQPPVSPDQATIECVEPEGLANTIELVYNLRRA
ncbi:MAG: hypothetical protein FWF24_00720 [Alphaproteobacteria bacterium]|nr:hypothetical protein [Alphaproteobacteria bacterium]